ncbi:MAG: hypothetical protein J7L46_01920, partial [Bacteroidales bacterium]|nr:hypothetical protein [Bacteroidales bacterium]
MRKLINGQDKLINGQDNLIDGSITTVTFCIKNHKKKLSKMSIILLILSVLSFSQGFSQSFTISGYVT